MAKTKGDLVLKALRKAGLYSNATLTDADPQAIEDAINDLEDMMAAWQAKGIELGYQFADTENGIMPLQHGAECCLSRVWWQAVQRRK